MSGPPPIFPVTIFSERLGVLQLDEPPIMDQFFGRSYQASKPIPMFEREHPTVRSPGLQLVVWPPENGIPDTTDFVNRVHEAYDAIIGGLDSILVDSHAVIAQCIHDFWQIPGEPAPTVEQLTAEGELHLLILDLREGQHELHIYDGGLLGGHDLNLQLGPDLRARGGYFDG